MDESTKIVIWYADGGTYMALDDAKMLELEDGRLMPCVRMEPDNVMDVVEILVRKTREGAATEG